MITKTYKVPLYRKISEGHLEPSDTKSSDLFLEVNSKRIGTSNSNSPKSEIYSIDKTKTSLIVYTNTLGFKVTDIFYKNTPLYNVILIPTLNATKLLEELSAKSGSKFITELLGDSVAVYLNHDDNTIVLGGIEYRVELIYPVRAPYLNHPNTKVKRLKDRLKVQITGIDINSAVVELLHEDLLRPKIHNENWVEFYECVIKDRSGKYLHIYNHSFELIEKSEYQKFSSQINYKVKDPVLSISYELSDNYINYIYNSYRSNLLFNTELNSDFYFYLNYSYTNKTDLIKISFKEQASEDLLEVFRLAEEEKTFDVLINPYINNKLHSLCGENFTLMFEEVKNNKYNKADDVRFGNTRILLDLERTINNVTEYINVGDTVIYQKDNYELPPTVEGNILPQYLQQYKSAMDNLKNKLENNLNTNQTIGSDEKSYYTIT